MGRLTAGSPVLVEGAEDGRVRVEQVGHHRRQLPVAAREAGAQRGREVPAERLEGLEKERLARFLVADTELDVVKHDSS